MAQRTLTEQGAAVARYEFDGQSSIATVDIRTAEGADSCALTSTEVAAALTAAERTTLRQLLAKLYTAALTKKGYV